MALSVMRLNSTRFVHCLCKTNASLNSPVRRLPDKIHFKIQLPHTVQVKCVSTETSKRKEVVYSSQETKEVYRGAVSKAIYKVKAFSLMTSVFGIATQPIVLKSALESEPNLALTIGACTFVGFFTFVTPVLLHILTKRYILKLDYCPQTDSYYAMTYSFFLKNNVDKFKASDVFVPDMPGMLTSFEVKGKPYFIDKDSFLDLNHYRKLMGYDKPIDFKLGKPKSEDV